MSRPVPSTPDVAKRMSRQRRRDTGPEVELRRRLHARGMRYRVAWPIPGMRRRTVDIAFTRRRVAVFVDGCFWHSCPEHGTMPRANAAWWSGKLAANQQRDRSTDAHLVSLGWSVIRVWEHEAAADAAERVAKALAVLDDERTPGRAEGESRPGPPRRVRTPGVGPAG